MKGQVIDCADGHEGVEITVTNPKVNKNIYYNSCTNGKIKTRDNN